MCDGDIGAIDCNGCDCNGCDCNGCDCNGCDCNSCDCNGCDCNSCDCNGCDLNSCDCSCDFSSCTGDCGPCGHYNVCHCEFGLTGHIFHDTWSFFCRCLENMSQIPSVYGTSGGGGYGSYSSVNNPRSTTANPQTVPPQGDAQYTIMFPPSPYEPLRYGSINTP